MCDLFFVDSEVFCFSEESKVWSIKKDTTFWNGHFATISGHFIANYISQNWGSDDPFEVLKESES